MRRLLRYTGGCRCIRQQRRPRHRLRDARRRAADQHLAKLQQLDLVRALREALASALEARECTLDKIASQLGMAPRQLRYELQSAGTSFQNEINNYRRALAKRLLANSETSISEVVYLTGFSEPSTFYRAFKRWEGLTPIEYRLQQSIKK